MIGNRNSLKIATLFVAIFVLTRCCIAATHFSVSPPATFSGTDGNGTPRSITGALPTDFKEDNEVITSDGSYSNKVYFEATVPADCPYTLRIKISGDLTSGSHTIPYSSLRYMYTYGRNITFGITAPGTKLNYAKYRDFSTSYQDVYISGSTAGGGTYEVPPISGFPADKIRDWEHQFKYAIQVPNNTYPGVYTATITYRADPAGTERTADISVTVGDYFRLSIDRGTIDFENMSPGTTKDNVPVEGVIVTAKTNTGRPWFLKISNDSPLSSGPYMIPNSNFIWYGWTDGSGTWYGNGTDTMNFVPSLVYSSSPTEMNNLPDGTGNHLKFKLTIPRGQPGGKYLSNVKLTLTE